MEVQEVAMGYYLFICKLQVNIYDSKLLYHTEIKNQALQMLENNYSN